MENIRKKLREDLTSEDLAVWFGTKKKSKGSKQPKGPWVNICRKEDGKHPPCGRDKATSKGYPKCRAVGVAARMTDAQKKAACAQKRRAEKEEPKVGKGNKPTMTSYKPRKESIDNIIKRVLFESKFASDINYPFMMKILNKMYGYQIDNIDVLKSFEKTPYYKETNNSFDYMDQYNNYMIGKKKGYILEATDSSSTGSYETPGFLAKNIPNMRQGAKTTYAGGKFVKIKAKCRKFPYCNQGAIDNPLELSDKYKGESSLSGEMKLTPTYPKGYKGNVYLPKTKWMNESLEYSGRDVTKLPVIGRVITYPIGTYGEGEENVVEIVKGRNGEDIYITDKWYKEYKRIPLIIHSKLVKEYIPLNINESYQLSDDDKLKSNWAVFKIMYGKKYYATRLNEANKKIIDQYSSIKYSNDDVLKFTYKEALGLIKANGGFGIKMGTVNNKGIQKVYDMSNKKGYIASTDDVKHIQEEMIPGGKSSGKTIKEIAKKHKVSPQTAMKEWLKGIKVEMEHTTNKKIAREIAKDHLYEDIFYYQKLAKIEN